MRRSLPDLAAPEVARLRLAHVLLDEKAYDEALQLLEAKPLDAYAAQAAAPSANVQSLQRRAAGVLPVRIDVPRAGTSHRFIKPLVVDEETMVQFRYQKR